MKAEIVGVGTEILLGQICNDNARWMSERLAEIGVDVVHHQAVGDNLHRIVEAFRVALARADVLLVTGGLGPTQDDITREGLSEALGITLARIPEIEGFLRERFRRFGRAMPESNLRQADVPVGARYILPKRGTAPGLALETPTGGRIYAVAGVPAEMREMMAGTILPELAALAGPSTIVSRQLTVIGMAESKIAEVLDDLFRASTNPSVAYLAGGGQVRVRLTAKAGTAAEAGALIEPLAEEVRRRLGPSVFSADGETLEEVVGRLLREQGKTVACAESLTGGGLAARLTGVEGASDYFVGSAVTYTAGSKHDLLGVAEDIIRGPGVVSEACARSMAEGARRVFGSDLAVALTGVAGPDPHDGKPPGTVCVGLCWAEGEGWTRTFRAPGGRPDVVRWAQQAALDLLRRRLLGLPEPGELGPATGSRTSGVGPAES